MEIFAYRSSKAIIRIRGALDFVRKTISFGKEINYFIDGINRIIAEPKHHCAICGKKMIYDKILSQADYEN